MHDLDEAYQMWWQLLGHIGIPLLFGIAFIFFSIASSTASPTWDIAIETALDFGILGIGATGAVFENEVITKAFSEHSAVVGIAIVGIDFLLVSFIILIRRYIFEVTQRKLLWSVISLSLGCLALLTTSEVLAYAYKIVPIAGSP
jgi:hypothetical protein